MATILVVEDDTALAGMLTAHLIRDGFDVLEAADGATALNVVTRRRPNAVVLDIGLPGLDGFEVCRVLRQHDDWTPVIVLTARDAEDDRVLGLELGADDYVTKPFSPRELTFRLRGLLRRAAAEVSTKPHTLVRRLGDVEVDVDARQVTLAGQPVELAPRELELLAYLAERPGRVVSREQLLSHVWGPDSTSGPRTVDVHVAQLRAKGIDVIKTVRGFGYSARAEP